MNTTTQSRDLLLPLVTPRVARSGEWLDGVYARIVFSHLTEPGDTEAGQLTGMLGYREVLDLIQQPEPVERIQERLVALGVLMHDADIAAAVKRWLPRLNFKSIDDTLAVAASKGIHVITEYDSQWPEGFFRLGSESPHVLWVHGNIDALNSGQSTVAIVGARAATSYGEHVAMELAADLATDHIIVSGAAYGIDGAAHRACLAAGGTTVAYLAGGCDRPYPMGHAQLIERVTAKGAVVSEVPPGSAPTKWRFLARNRLIAAHGDATVVVEAGFRSGSLNTAGHADSLGKPLGAVPGPITSAASAGAHRLIQEFGAKLIISADDVRKLTGKEED